MSRKGMSLQPVTIALGANLGERRATLEAALNALRALPGFEVGAVSRWHETEPVGGPPEQPRYLNGVLLGRTSLSAHELLRALQAIELCFGRERSVPNGPRTLDLDLIHFGELRCAEAELELPHPRSEERLFVLEPLLELAPERILPLSGQTVAVRVAHLRARATPRGAGALIACSSPQAAQPILAQWRAQGLRIGFVPTMGALHEGHLALVRRARQNADRVVVSIFVNPLQFDDPRDLERYPRDFANDTRLLESAGASLAFTGTLEQFFPPAQGGVRRIDPGPCAQGLEGALRPGHFEGVATIVDRLFAIVEPHEATFGQKDFQQTLVVRDLARRRGAPRICVAPTVREPEGLAMSSRNVFLKPDERRRALAIHAALRGAHALYASGVRDAGTLGAFLRGALSKEQLEIQYATVRDPEVWTPEEPKGELANAVALIAVKLGSVRLIDNWVLSSPDGGL